MRPRVRFSLLTGAVHLFHFFTIKKWLENMEEGLRISHAKYADTLLSSTKKNNARKRYFSICGGGEIRTHGTVSSPLVFKTSAIDHSTTLPYRNTLTCKITKDSRVRRCQWVVCFYMAPRIGFEPMIPISKTGALDH